MKRRFRRKRLDRWIAGTLDDAKLLGLEDEDRQEILFEAKRRFDAGDLDAASRLFRLATLFFPRDATALIGLGACSQASGDLTTASKHYEAALMLQPGDTFASMNRAECALLASDRDTARKLLSNVAPGELRAYLPADVRGRLETLETSAAAEPTSSSPSATERVDYAIEPDLSEAEFHSVLERSTLAERRPLQEPGTLAGMLSEASVILTARLDGLLIGISRAISDHHFCTYLSDLAVDRAHQNRGIGRELIRRTHEAAGLKTTLILLAAPVAREYYPHIGMTAHDSCWVIWRQPVS